MKEREPVYQDPRPSSEIPNERTIVYASDLSSTRTLVSILKTQGESVDLFEGKNIYKEDIVYIVAPQEKTPELKLIQALMWHTPEYYNVWHADISRTPKAEEEAKILFTQSYSSVMDQVGGRDYFKPDSKTGLTPLYIYRPRQIDLLLAEVMTMQGFDLRVFDVRHNDKIVLATGEGRNTFAYARTSIEAELISAYFAYGQFPNTEREKSRLNDRVQILLRNAVGISDEDLQISRAYGAHLRVEDVKDNDLIGDERKEKIVSRAKKRIERLGIDEPQERIKDVVAKLIQIGERRAEERKNEDFSFDAYNKGDLETGILESRIAKITEEIADLYGLDHGVFSDLPALDFVDYDEFTKRIMYIYTDNVSPSFVIPSSNYSPPGTREFGESTGHLISIFYENMGDQTLIEETLHWMHQVSVNYQESQKGDDKFKADFFNAVISEALAFITTKIFLPIRHRDQDQKNICGLQEGFDQSKLEELILQSGETFDQVLLEACGVATYDEWLRRHMFMRSLGKFPAEIVHAIGYFLGEEAFKKLSEGKILPSQLKNIFFKPDDPSGQYKQLIRLIK